MVIGEDHRCHVAYSVSAHDLAPDPAPRQVRAGSLAQQSYRGGLSAQFGPPVDRRGVLGLDQGGQDGEVGNLGEGRDADLGDRVGEQPNVRTERDHVPQDVKGLPPQLPVGLSRRVGHSRRRQGNDALAGAGPRPGTGHPSSLTAPGGYGAGSPPRILGYGAPRPNAYRWPCQRRENQEMEQLMATLRIEHAIHDYDTWQQAFDRFAEARAVA